MNNLLKLYQSPLCGGVMICKDLLHNEAKDFLKPHMIFYNATISQYFLTKTRVNILELLVVPGKSDFAKFCGLLRIYELYWSLFTAMPCSA